MGKKRDYINEILDKKHRLLSRSTRFEQFTKRSNPIQRALNESTGLPSGSPLRSEILRYAPIGMVAAMEGYFRLLIADIVDRDAEHAQRIVDYDNLNFRPDVVLALQNRKVSLGEFVSHTLPFRNLESIDRNLSVVLGYEFLKRTFHEPYVDDSSILQLLPDILTDIAELFQVRHVLSHELALKERTGIRRVERITRAGVKLVIITEVAMRDLMP